MAGSRSTSEAPDLDKQQRQALAEVTSAAERFRAAREAYEEALVRARDAGASWMVLTNAGGEISHAKVRNIVLRRRQKTGSRKAPAKLTGRTGEVLALLRRKEGATWREILTATGWSSLGGGYARSVAKRAGMELEQVTRATGERAYRAVDRKPEPVGGGRKKRAS